MRNAFVVLAVLGLLFGACNGGDSAPDATEEPDSSQPVTGPAELTASDQEGDGTTVTVDSVTLPTDGFIAVHADADGNPGPVIGHSDLLDEGTSTDVVITLDTPLEATASVWPMAHVDANGNGVYEFTPPDEVIDIPATFASGDTAVVSVTVTVA